ncbi:MAG: hypothetical protein E6Q42_12560 [Dechloromonas sp.]|nr:MAG: hypothetical protein E6Q42_12560 [Dechloromonas sp.]
MTTSITRPAPTGRLRLQSIPEASQAGNLDAIKLMICLSNIENESNAAKLLAAALGEIVALAAEHRFEECDARRQSFCEAIAPVLNRAAELEAKCALLTAALNQAERVSKITADEQRAINAAISTCSHVSAGRIIAAHPNDDDAIVTLCELQLAVRALEPKFTESEGGEL